MPRMRSKTLVCAVIRNHQRTLRDFASDLHGLCDNGRINLDSGLANPRESCCAQWRIIFSHAKLSKLLTVKPPAKRRRASAQLPVGAPIQFVRGSSRSTLHGYIEVLPEWSTPADPVISVSSMTDMVASPNTAVDVLLACPGDALVLAFTGEVGRLAGNNERVAPRPRMDDLTAAKVVSASIGV